MSGYIGSQPADSFLSISSQQITGNGGATYTLNLSVTSPEDVAVFVNNVRQNPNTYSVSNNQITLGGTIASSDSCYVVFLGKTLATVNPPSGSVGNNQVSASLINSQTAESSANDSDEILIYDNSATALKKQTRANFLTGVGGANTPTFEVYKSSHQTVSDAVTTKVTFDTEVFDTANAFASDKFTVPQDGKYRIYSQLTHYSVSSGQISDCRTQIYKNGSQYKEVLTIFGSTQGYFISLFNSAIMDLAVGDYIEMYAQINVGSGTVQVSGSSNKETYFGGFKIIE